ncbi:MAG: M20/M25/M40 family metallo-hydrolase [Deltaproteobacteria bacterium]|nr:M20/M25/M40 family metallo-hydrolase [Deltaproteobacteria bacterium]
MTARLGDPVRLTLDLCGVESTTGSEAHVMELAAGLCRTLGLAVRTQEVGAPGRVNVAAWDPAVAPEVLFTTHLDTVPPYLPPAELADRLTGRGTCDAKGAAAAMLCALSGLRQAGELRVGVMFLVGEETESDGARAAATGFAPRLRYFINGEPTGLTLASAQKGTLSFRLVADGMAGHSAYPERGRSATHALVDAAHALLHHTWPADPELGDTTVNVGLLDGGVAPNVLAPSATARGIFRLGMPVDDAERTARALLPPHVRLERLGGTDPVRCHVPPGEHAEVVRFGSDIPYLQSVGTPLLLGPGSIHDAHTDHEHVLKADLIEGTRRYAALARALLGG